MKLLKMKGLQKVNSHAKLELCEELGKNENGCATCTRVGTESVSKKPVFIFSYNCSTAIPR
jgi:hypothetical protein